MHFSRLMWAGLFLLVSSVAQSVSRRLRANGNDHLEGGATARSADAEGAALDNEPPGTSGHTVTGGGAVDGSTEAGGVAAGAGGVVVDEGEGAPPSLVRLPGKPYLRRPRASLGTWLTRPLQTLQAQKEVEAIICNFVDGMFGATTEWEIVYTDGSRECGESEDYPTKSWDRPYDYAESKLGWQRQVASGSQPWSDGLACGSRQVFKRDFPPPEESPDQTAQRYAHAEETGNWGQKVCLSSLEWFA